MTIRDRLPFIAAAIAAAMATVSLPGAANAFDVCNAYAASAVQQNQRNERLGCGYHGVRWHNWHEGHESWCRKVNWSVARAELQRRELKLTQCRFH